MKITKLFSSFFESEKSGGLLLIFCTIVSLALANSTFSGAYISFWHLKFGFLSLETWINDGLMAIFFLLIGLELKREFYVGELSRIRNAMLPFFAALGGMIVPVLIYLLFNFGSKNQLGFGIPMATDIAFALAILSLLGKKIPTSLKVFLTALAVLDDLGAIIVIAIFYSKTIIWLYLLASLSIFAVLLVFNRLRIKNLFFYIIPGVLMWVCMFNSGIHATISGVLLALVIPFRTIKINSPADLLQDILHLPVAYFVLPIFAMANTALLLNFDWKDTFFCATSLGIALGLLIGKPIGIFVFSYFSVRAKISKLPYDMSWKSLFGASILGGIGFTMYIFITLLAFYDINLVQNSKMVVLTSSFLSGLVGFLFLKLSVSTKKD